MTATDSKYYSSPDISVKIAVVKHSLCSAEDGSHGASSQCSLVSLCHSNNIIKSLVLQQKYFLLIILTGHSIREWNGIAVGHSFYVQNHQCAYLTIHHRDHTD